MSGISAHALRVEDRLARDERTARRTCACGGRKHPRAARCMKCTRAHRSPCADPHATGCQTLVSQPGRACIACNRKRGLSHTYRSTRDAP